MDVVSYCSEFLEYATADGTEQKVQSLSANQVQCPISSGCHGIDQAYSHV